jgi:putative tricarboxylic transport membrane protein
VAGPGFVRARNLVGPIIGSVLGLLILILSFQIRDTSSTIYGPRFWPQVIGTLMLAFNAWVLIRTITGHPEPREEALDAGADSPAPLRPGAAHWITALLVIGFPLIVYLMGFLVGSGVFLIAFMLALGYRRLIVIGPTAVIFTVLLTWFFTAGVFTPLPPGKGVFYDVSAEFARLTQK